MVRPEGHDKTNLLYSVLFFEPLKERRVDELDSLGMYDGRLVHAALFVEEFGAEFSLLCYNSGMERRVDI